MSTEISKVAYIGVFDLLDFFHIYERNPKGQTPLYMPNLPFLSFLMLIYFDRTYFVPMYEDLYSYILVENQKNH